MAIDAHRLAADFRSLTPEQLLAEYADGQREFQGVNLLRGYIEALAPQISEREYRPPAAGLRFGYWRETVSPLWVDRRTWSPPAELYDGAPVFHWETNEFECLLEKNWEEVEEWPEVEVADLVGTELPEINLQGSYLHRVNLSGADLEGAKLQRAILVDVDLSGANLRRADLRESLMAGIRFHAADLTLARAERANLQGADFSGADLTRVRFRRANLSATVWKESVLLRTRFDRNSLMRADFRGLDLAGVRFGDSVITGCRIVRDDESLLLDSLSVLR